MAIKNDLFVRVQQHEWNQPICDDWVDTLEKYVMESNNSQVLIAHSLGCLLVAHWAAKTTLNHKVKGALLVAPPDPNDINFPKELARFAALPAEKLPFSSIVVASTDDPYASIDFSIACASMWGSMFLNLGNAGHINSSSGFGEWQEGYALFNQLALGI